MKLVCLGETARFINGAAFKPTDWGSEGLPIIRIQNLTGTSQEFNYTTREVKPELLVEPDDLLVSWSATLDVYRLTGPRAVLNQHIFKVIPNPGVDTDYLYYVLKSVIVELESKTHGSTMKHVVRGDFESTRVPLPSLAEQRRIVDILARAEGIVRLRREAQKKAAEIIPALFFDMFGDPATNPKGWPVVTVGDLIHAAQDGPHVSPAYTDSGVPFLSTRHIKPGQILFQDLRFLTEGEAARQWKKCKPQRGDVLYTKGGTTGIAAAIDFDTEIAVWVHVAVLKTDHSKVHPLWLESMLNSTHCYRQSQELTHGIANRDLGLKRMVKISAYLPSKDKQQRFVDMAMRILAIQEQQVSAAAKAGATFNALLATSFPDREQVRSVTQSEVAVG